MDQAAAIRDIAQRFQAIMLARTRTRPSQPVAGLSHSQDSGLADVRQTPEQDPAYALLLHLSLHPQRYMKPGLTDRALEVMDLATLYAQADEAAERDASLGHQDHLIKALLAWFKTHFFRWINAPTCSLCGADTTAMGATQPSAEEHAVGGASRTEVYRCTHDANHIERFPRYDDPETLLTWRKGRCGEFANCFTLLAMALGSRARWVYNYEDHVWTEVYSVRLGRWVHCDACENAWDAPQTYAVGWGKRMSHCVGFSASGAQDVTRRYVRDDAHALPEEKVPSPVMRRAVRDINHALRQTLSAAERATLEREDAEEETELAGYRVVPSSTKREEEQPRVSGSTAWKDARGENGK